MLTKVMIALCGGIITYFFLEFIKSVRQFYIFKRVREVALESIFMYLKDTPEKFIDLSIMRQHVFQRLQEIKLSAWVSDIKLSWNSVDAILFVFELNFEKLKPKYKFVIGLKDMEKFLQRM